MARKSTPSSKTSKEQTNAAIVTDAGAKAQTGAEAAAEKAPMQAKPEVKPETRLAAEPRTKLEVVKTEPRRVFPINLEDEIRRRAYELYKQRGTGTGSEAEDWLNAEREVRQRYRQQQSA
jgi:Protein of unknown function (DUF2934)